MVSSEAADAEQRTAGAADVVAAETTGATVSAENAANIAVVVVVVVMASVDVVDAVARVATPRHLPMAYSKDTFFEQCLLLRVQLRRLCRLRIPYCRAFLHCAGLRGFSGRFIMVSFIRDQHSMEKRGRGDS